LQFTRARTGSIVTVAMLLPSITSRLRAAARGAEPHSLRWRW
jgi:hypothetical protein